MGSSFIPFHSIQFITQVSSAPLHVDFGNYVFDPESIPQNEEILKLFIQFATDTANRLIHLKIKSKLDPEDFNKVKEYFPNLNNTPSYMANGDATEKTVQPDVNERKPNETDVSVNSNTEPTVPEEKPEVEVDVENRGLFGKLKLPFIQKLKDLFKDDGQHRGIPGKLFTLWKKVEKLLIEIFGEDMWNNIRKGLCHDMQARTPGNEQSGGPRSLLNAGTQLGINTLRHGYQVATDVADYGRKQTLGAFEHVQRPVSDSAEKMVDISSKTISSGFGLF